MMFLMLKSLKIFRLRRAILLNIHVFYISAAAEKWTIKKAPLIDPISEYKGGS